MILELQVNEDIERKLSELTQRSGNGNYADTIRKALALYDLATEHLKDGSSITLNNPDGSKENLDIK